MNKLERIAELHDKWDSLSDDETQELIDLKNSIDLSKDYDFTKFDEMNRADLQIDGKFYKYISKD